MTSIEISPISPSEYALHQELLVALHTDLERARQLNAGRDEYLTKSEFYDRGEKDLYNSLSAQLSAVGGHKRAAQLLAMRVSKGGAGTHK